MAIIITCECGRKFRARDEHAGKRAKCPECGHVLVITPSDLPKMPRPPSSITNQPEKCALCGRMIPSDRGAGARGRFVCNDCQADMGPGEPEGPTAEDTVALARATRSKLADKMRPRRAGLIAFGVSLTVLSLGMHLVFCEWSFDDSTTGAYCIIAFSQKPNPLLPRDHPDQQVWGVVNGLFARNDLPRIGAEVDPPSPPGDIPGAKVKGPWRTVGTHPGAGSTELAIIFGVFAPVVLLVAASYVIYVGLRKMG